MSLLLPPRASSEPGAVIGIRSDGMRYNNQQDGGIMVEME